MSATAPKLGALVGLLGEEREALAALVHRLTVASMLVAHAQDRRLAAAGDDILAAADQLGELELARAVVVTEVAAEWGLDDDQPSLSELIAHAPDEYRSVLESHLTEMRRLATEVTDLAAVGQKLAGEASERVAAAIDRLETSGTGGGYGDGRSGPPPASFDGSA